MQLVVWNTQWVVGRWSGNGEGGPLTRIFLTFGTTRVIGRQPYAPAAFTPGEIPGTHFQGLSRPQGTWFRRRGPRKKSLVTTPGIDPGTVRLVVQCLNHYATPGPKRNKYQEYFLGGKGGRCVGLTTLPPSCADSWNLKVSTSWNPQGLTRSVQGLLYLLEGIFEK